MTVFWNKVLNEAEKERLVSNIAGHLKNAQMFLQVRGDRREMERRILPKEEMWPSLASSCRHTYIVTLNCQVNT